MVVDGDETISEQCSVRKFVITTNQHRKSNHDADAHTLSTVFANDSPARNDTQRGESPSDPNFLL
jgi:hypothetical protein